MGFVIEDNNQQFLLAEAIYGSCLSAKETEIRAIKEVVKKAWIRKGQKIVIESDAEGVIQKIN